MKAIDQAFKNKLIYHGSGISPPRDEIGENQPAKIVARILLHGGQISPALLKASLFKAVFIKNEPQLMKDFFNELQSELDHLTNLLPATEQETVLWKGFLGNVLALLPFSYPADGSTIQIPYLDTAGKCQKITYDIDVLQLTPGSSSSPVTALGLRPQNDNFPAILTFLGTTFPGADGFATTVLADFTPNKSVGEAIYHLGKEKIALWLKDREKVHLIGMSLGGALAFHTLGDHLSKICRTDVYNPPGL
jgi:hypothetical protein